MYEVRKGFNFRFSQKEIADLDELVVVFGKRGNFPWFYGDVSRVAVIRKLVKDALHAIEEQAKKDNGLTTQKELAKPAKTKKRKNNVGVSTPSSAELDVSTAKRKRGKK